MKKVKNYIDIELAKKKVARYKYWSIKDENGITITSSNDEQEGRSFNDLLNKIVEDNVDAEIQIKYGTNEQSARHNIPFFIRVNEEIEWIEPEEDETVSINGVKHKVDKNGNVNINLTTNQPEIEQAEPYYSMRDEMEIQLKGIRQEHELTQEKMRVELANKLFEQTLNFKSMMLDDRESRLNEREQNIQAQETNLEDRENEVQGNLQGYLKQVPSALGGLFKDFMAGANKDEKQSKPLAGTTKKKAIKRKAVKFSFQENNDKKENENKTQAPAEQKPFEDDTQIDLLDAITIAE